MKYYGRLTRQQWEVYCIFSEDSPKTARKYKRKCCIENKTACALEKENKNLWKIAFSSGFDSVTYKRFFPGDDFTPEEWQDFVDCEKLVICSPFDCSGQWFTISLERFPVPGGIWVYHHMALDC